MKWKAPSTDLRTRIWVRRAKVSAQIVVQTKGLHNNIESLNGPDGGKSER